VASALLDQGPARRQGEGLDPERLELLRDAAMVDWGSLPPSAKAEKLAKLHGRATALTTHTPVGFNPSTGQPYADRGQRQVVDASHDELHRTIEDTASGIRASAETIARIATPGENLKGLAAGVVLGGAGALGAGKVKAAAAVQNKPNLVDAERTKHILVGDDRGGGHRHGTNRPGKSEFPASCSDDKILQEISDVRRDPGSKKASVRDGGSSYSGTRDGVDIKVIVSNTGRIVTGHPTNLPRNPPRGKK
jgi:hypothetical protein